MSHPCLVESELSPMLQMPVGLAMTCVTVVNSPSGSVESATLVNSGGMVTVVCPFESVVENTTGLERVVSG